MGVRRKGKPETKKGNFEQPSHIVLMGQQILPKMRRLVTIPPEKMAVMYLAWGKVEYGTPSHKENGVFNFQRRIRYQLKIQSAIGS